MEFSPEQNRAVDAVWDWFKNHSQEKPIFRLFGYAGTGKTTLAQHIAQGVDGLVLFAAFTGKAAHVLHTKGCPGTTTIHKLIYSPQEKSRKKLQEMCIELEQLRAKDPDGREAALLAKRIEEEKLNLQRPSWKLNLDSELRRAALLVVDEASMVDGQIGEDLLYFGVPILALGDPAQLPPVKGAGFFTNAKADFMLKEIHRQAKNNPIIELSRRVREGQELQVGQYGTCNVVTLADWDRDELFQSDQLLVGRNATRRSFNARYRVLKGIEGKLPVQGDKLICLRNNHDAGLLNGSQWVAHRVGDVFEGMLELGVKGESGELVTTIAHACHFHGQEPEWYEKKDADEFDYGYAMTVHKSQGSQWDHVLLFDEWHAQGRKEWLYTGITRAAKRLSIIKM